MNEIGPDSWWNPFYAWHRLVSRARVSPCHGCDDQSPHNAHLTLYGRWHYVGRYWLRNKLRLT